MRPLCQQDRVEARAQCEGWDDEGEDEDELSLELDELEAHNALHLALHRPDLVTREVLSTLEWVEHMSWRNYQEYWREMVRSLPPHPPVGASPALLAAKARG